MSNRQADLQKLISRGHSAAWDQNWNDAAEYYRQALEMDSENIKAITSLGLALFEMREYRESLEQYLRASDVDPDDPLAYEKITLIHERMGNPEQAREYALQAADAFIKNEDIDKAIENWNRAIEIDPHHVRAHARLALVFQRLGYSNKAVTKFIHVASILQNSGQVSKASEAVERALKLAPESIKAVRAKEMIQQGAMIPLPERFQEVSPPPQNEPKLQLEEPEDTEGPQQAADPVEEMVENAITTMAKSVFEEKIRLERMPEEETSRPDTFLEEEGDEGEGPRVVDDSLMKLHIFQAIEKFNQQDGKAAAEELKNAVDAGYTHPAAFFLLGITYFDLGRLESAERNLKRAVSREGFDLGSRIVLAHIYREREQWEEASKEYLEALSLADTSIAPQEEVADLRDLYEAMIEDLEAEEGDEAYQEVCDHVEKLLMRPDWREKLEKHREQSDQEALGLLPVVDDIIEERKKQVFDGHQQIQNLAEEGYFGAAMEKAFFALRQAPSYIPLHITIGDLLLQQGQHQGAVAKYRAVADVYSVQGKMNRALEMLKKVIEIEPMNIDVRQRYIHCLEEYGKKQEAITEYNNLADVFYNLAELDRARETYSSALELARGFEGEVDWQKNILLRLADIDIQRLDWEAALNTFREISQNYPLDQETSINIVNIHYQLGNDLLARDEMDRYLNQLDLQQDREDILSYLESLRDERPRKKDVRTRLASFYEDLGQKEKAIAELDSLGDMLLDEGRKDEVVDIIQKIIAMEPPNAADYRQLLGQLT